MYLLDTMVLSEETKRAPNDGVMRWLEETGSAATYVSVASIAEIARGVEQQRRRDASFAGRLEVWAVRTEARFFDRLLGVDHRVARLWGELWQRLGFNSPDVILAATALVHGLTVVTRNVRHFERTGVAIINPYAEAA